MAILRFNSDPVGKKIQAIPGVKQTIAGWPQIETEIQLPASKSLSNRYLILNALADQSTMLMVLSKANDTQVLQGLLNKIHTSESETLELNCEDAGTVWRFLLAFCCIQVGRTFILQGSERLKQRPIAALVKALNDLGADIEVMHDGRLKIIGKAWTKNSVSLDAGISSQFISALLLIAPFTAQGLKLNWKKEPVSESYINLTLDCLTEFGVQFKREEKSIHVKSGFQSPKSVQMERDWSSASYFLALAAQHRFALFFPDLNMDSSQGDAFAADYFRYFGLSFEQESAGVHVAPRKLNWSVQPWTVNVKTCPDLAPTLICHAGSIAVKSAFTGLETLSGKESDRIAALQAMMAQFGVLFKEDSANFWSVSEDRLENRKVLIQTHQDHRMAMCAPVLLSKGGRLELDDVQCVQKSFPDFWNELEKLGIRMEF